MTHVTPEQLAQRLALPPASLPAFRDLNRAQVALLSDAIERACDHRRRALDDAFAELPPGARSLLLGLLRSRVG